MAKQKKRTRLTISLLLIAVLIGGIYAASGLGGEMPAGLAPAASPGLTLSGSPAPAAPNKSPAPNVQPEGALDIYVIDAGQGDSIFLRSPSGKTMLVDATTSSKFAQVDAFLTAQAVTRLDIVVATHPHEDHIGGMAKLLEGYEIGEFYMPDATTNTKTFERMLDALEKHKVNVKKAEAGMLLSWDEAVEVRLLSPIAGQAHKDLNDYSVVCRVKLGDTAAVLAGDAESAAEQAMLREFPASYFRADVLKAGHHGSRTSTSAAFFDAVKPAYVIMSLGKDNTYGHPHQETLDLLRDAGVPYYRTDECGTVHVRLDGKNVTVETEKDAEPGG